MTSGITSDYTSTICPLSVTNSDRPVFNTRSQIHQCLSMDTSPLQPDVMTEVSKVPGPTPKSLTADRLEALLQMLKTDPFCKRISKHLWNGKALQHETDLFIHIRGLLYKHITYSGQKFLASVIPKSWKYTILVEAHNKLGHQGNTCTYCLIKCQYYWKGMNKDIRKYITNCTLCHREKAKVQAYALQMTGIPDRPFDKIVINLVMECETSTSGNEHISQLLPTLQVCQKHSP